MINAVGREIPQEVLSETGKKVFQGTYKYDRYEYKKTAVKSRARIGGNVSKIEGSIEEILKKCGVHDGMTISFHHHFREGDLVVMQVMNTIHKMGYKDIKICASSLDGAQDELVDMIEDGTVTRIETSGVRGQIGEAITDGKLKGIAILHSHGGRVRAIETGETKIDIAFIGAPSCDEYGNCRGVGGNSNCGVLSYAAIDAEYAEYVVALTDCIVPFPNFPADISMTQVDYVVKVDAVGDAEKIATGAAKPVTDMRKLMMAQSCADFIACTPCLLDTQNFDLPSIDSLISNPKHFSITTKEYADPFCKGAVVNKLDFVILGTLEADINFNCNVVVSSEGKLMGAQGGHPDTAAGAKCTIVITPLLQGRIPAVRNQVTTVTTPGETVDVIVTDYGIAINPKRTDLLEAVKDSHISLKTIEELRDIAYGMAGEPEPLEYEDRVVAVIESRDGTIMDVVRKRKDKTPN